MEAERISVELTPKMPSEPRSVASAAATLNTPPVQSGNGQGHGASHPAASRTNKKAAAAAECLMVTVVVIIRLADFVGMLSLWPRDCQPKYLLARSRNALRINQLQDQPRMHGPIAAHTVPAT
jgi:hypothetical protein